LDAPYESLKTGSFLIENVLPLKLSATHISINQFRNEYQILEFKKKSFCGRLKIKVQHHMVKNVKTGNMLGIFDK